MYTGLALSFIAGFAVMNAEIAAGRLFAPYYGTSTTTWALLIATILLSLTCGNVLGGRLSRRAPERWLIRLLAIAALFLALAPRLGPWFMAGSLERFQRGDLQALATSASAAIVLLAVPIACLGAMPPLVLQMVGGRVDRLDAELGRLSGRLSALGTLGSLVGTLAAGLVLIPWVGTMRTMDIGAGALALTAVALAARHSFRMLAVPATITTILFLVVMRVSPAAAVPVGKLVHATESRHNYISIVDVGPERQLRVNDGFAVQSWVYRDGRLPMRDVWSFYGLAPAWSARPTVKRVLLLGMGGGTAAELYQRLYPGVRVTGVELDADMVRAGRQQLGLALDGVEVVIADARTFIARAAVATPATWDVIILDAFQFPYVPFQLTTREFFGDLSRCLTPGGVLMVNAGRRGEHRDVVFAIERTLAAVFAHVAAADAPNPSNTIIVAGAHDPIADGIGIASLAAHSPFGSQLTEEARRLPRMRPATWPSDTPLLTDDHAPVEWLTDRIVWSFL